MFGPTAMYLSLLLLPALVQTALVPETWNLCGVELTNGDKVTGSFVFDAEITAPTPPYLDIDIFVNGVKYEHLNPLSTGNNGFIFALAGNEPQSGQDLTGRQNIALSFTQGLTDQGGTVPIATSDGTLFAGTGACANSGCSDSTPVLRLAKNSPFVSTNPCPPVEDPPEDDEGCEGPSGVLSFFGWLFCIIFDFIGSIFG